MADSTYYLKTTYTYAPDPNNLGKYIRFEGTSTSSKVKCGWCKSLYISDKHHNCPNCGGPQIEHTK